MWEAGEVIHIGEATGDWRDNDKSYELIVIDDKIKDILSIMQHDRIYLDLDVNKKLNICKVNLSDEVYEPDQYSRKRLLENLVYKENEIGYRIGSNIMRRAKESFVDYIINKNVFVNLVQYVKKHGKYKEQEESIIIDEYKRLIEEYYKVIKEE